MAVKIAEFPDYVNFLNWESIKNLCNKHVIDTYLFMNSVTSSEMALIIPHLSAQHREMRCCMAGTF